jgi:hypothetical protein
MLKLTQNELITLERILYRHYTLLNNDPDFQRRFTVPEIIETRQVYLKVFNATTKLKGTKNGKSESKEKEKTIR